MRPFIAVLFLSAALSACSAKDVTEIICEDIVRAVDADPSALKINSVSSLSGALDAESIKRHYSNAFPDGVPEATKNLMDRRMAEASQYRDLFVEVDYTTRNLSGGPLRDKALCRYFDWGNQKQLVSITVHSKDYEYNDFMMIFLTYERPKGLDSLYRVK